MLACLQGGNYDPRVREKEIQGNADVGAIMVLGRRMKAQGDI